MMLKKPAECPLHPAWKKHKPEGCTCPSFVLRHGCHWSHCPANGWQYWKARALKAEKAQADLTEKVAKALAPFTNGAGRDD